jgi:hypothetical protein
MVFCIIVLSAPRAFSGVGGGAQDFGRKSFADSVNELERNLCDGGQTIRLMANEHFYEFLARVDLLNVSDSEMGGLSEQEFIDGIIEIAREDRDKRSLIFESCETRSEIVDCGAARELILLHKDGLMDLEYVDALPLDDLESIMAEMKISQCARIDMSAMEPGESPAHAVVVAARIGSGAHVLFFADKDGSIGKNKPSISSALPGSDRRHSAPANTGAPSLQALGDMLCDAGMHGDAAALFDLLPPPMVEAIVGMIMAIPDEEKYSEDPYQTARDMFVEDMEQEMKSEKLEACAVIHADPAACKQDTKKMFEQMDVEANISACGEMTFTTKKENGKEETETITAVEIDGRWYLLGD